MPILNNLVVYLGSQGGGATPVEPLPEPVIIPWEPDTLWPDLKAIIDNDTEAYVGKVAALFNSGPETFSFVLNNMKAQAVRTSDGSLYTVDTLHTWDPLQDITDSHGIKQRWVIWYYTDATSALITSTLELEKSPLVWLVIGSNGETFNWKYNTTFINRKDLQAIENHSGGIYDTTSYSVNMSSLFSGCSLLQLIPPINRVGMTVAASMFFNCYALQTIPLFDTSEITSTSSMFSGCSSLRSIQLLDTSNVLYMDNMFYGCNKLQTIPVFDTSKVTTMAGMFGGCTSLLEVPLLDTSLVTVMSSMFNGCLSLREIPLFDTSKVTTMIYMFGACSSLKTIPLFNTSLVTNMENMFNGCVALISIPLLNMSKVTTMSNMFYNCYSLQTIPLLDTPLVTDMVSTFSGCRNLSVPPQLDTSKVTTMDSIFNGCISLRDTPLLDTSKVTIMSNMFNGCNKLQSIDMSNTPLLTTAVSMFDGCTALKKVSINTSSILYMDDLFDGCPALIDAGTLDLTNVVLSLGIDADTFDFGDMLSAGIGPQKILFTPSTVNVPLVLIKPTLTHESLLSVIGGLVDRTATTALNVQLGVTNLAALSTEEKNMITAKNWTYS